MTRPIWHYTDVHGLWGIVTTSRLRFGDARFLNDRTERIYGEQLLKQVLDEEEAVHMPGRVAQLRDLLRVLRLADRLYVCSFSETAESISLWQRYGGDGTGYCIGFDSAQLDTLLKQEQIWRHEMLYSEEDQKEQLRREIRDALREYQDLDASLSGHNSGYLFTDTGLDEVAVRMKSPCFADEKESRYFLRGEDDGEPDDTGEEFAIRGSLIKPFVLRPALRSSGHKLPITQVVCGRRLDDEIAVPTTMRFLNAHGYAVSVVPSKLREIWG